MENFYNRNSQHIDYFGISSRIEQATNRVIQKINSLDLSALGISDYNHRYLKEHIKEEQKTKWYMSHIFMLAFENGASTSQTTLIDYGGGSGFLTCVALELGFEKVIYNDIYDVSCNDMTILAKTLNYNLSQVICGDIAELFDHLRIKKIHPDFLIAHDVIEHIYDVKSWFKEINHYPNLTVICTSHANKYNPLINHKLSRIHKRMEFTNRNREWGTKDRDQTESFLTIREKIIKDFNPAFEPMEVKSLAMKTRGLIKEEIERELADYSLNKRINYLPNHPSNTCDPYTGNWSEQLLDLSDLKKFLTGLGMNPVIKPGFYIDSKGSFLVRKMKLMANYLIYFLGFKGLYLSPYYIITVKSEAKT
jgi:hypothetical protein